MKKAPEGRHGAFAALADPTRRAILKLLRSGSRTAGDIADAFDLSKPTLSHHFNILRSAGLVRAEKRGTSVVYTLQSNVIEDVASELLDLVSSESSTSHPALTPEKARR